jgi:hypothetical protein
MKIELSPHARLAVLGAVVVLVGIAGVLFLKSRGSSSGSSAPSGVTRPLPPRHGKPVHGHPVRHAKPVHRPTAQPGKAAPLPREITAALAAGKTVVVILYDPRVKLDQQAFLEASAGADLAHASFSAVDVSTSDVDSLSTRFSILHDPSILVLRSPAAQLVVKIDGFADRDTVAQAAASTK